MEAFKNYLTETEKSPLTVEKYLRDTGCFLSWLKGRQITKAQTMAFKDWLIGRYAPVSVNSMLSSLNCYLRFLGLESCRVKILKTQRAAYCPTEKMLTRREYERLLRAAKGDEPLQLLMQTICSTGIRVSEHRFITVEAAKRGEALVRCKGKVRTVLLPRKLCKALLTYAKDAGIRSGSVFVTSGGKPMDRSRIWARMKRLCAEAKVSSEKVFPHNLRHLFARTYYSMEKDIIRLADILGHSNVNTTRIYTVENGITHRRQIEKMPLLLIT